MLNRLKIKLAALILGVFVVTSAHALLPLGAAAVWLGSAVTSSASLATALEASLYIHAGAIALYSIFIADKDSTGHATGPALEVKLNTAAARANPDSTKWDGPVSGARDVAPKSTIDPIMTPVSSGPYPTAAGSWVSYTYYWDGCYTNTSQYAKSFPDVFSAASALASAANKNFNCAGNASYGYNYSVFSVSESSKQFTLKLVCKPVAGTCPFDSTTQSSSVSSANPDPNYVPLQNASCPPGYTLSGSGSSCALTDASQVKKPATQPCEILRTSSGLQSDSLNSNCDGINLQGNSLQVGQQAISFNVDGSVSVSNPNGQTTFQIGSQNSDGSVTITGATRTGNPGSYSASTGGTTGSGSAGSSSGAISLCGGVGQPACSTGGSGNGGGSCGGPGQPKCGIDDSGFSGLADPGVAAKTAFDQAASGRDSAMRNQTDTSSSFSLSFDWVPKPSNFNQSCEPITGGIRGVGFSWDICKYVPLLAQIMGYLFYLFSGLYIWRSFTSTNTSSR